MRDQRSLVAPLHVSILMCFALWAPVSTAHAMVEFGAQASRPSARQPDRSDFSGKGVRIGVQDGGFNAGPWGDPAQTLTFAEFINKDAYARESLDTLGDHGAVVSRVIAGRDIGDTFGRGMAHASKLYVADAMNSPAPSSFALFYERGVSIINNSWDNTDTYDEMISWYQSVGKLNYAQGDEQWMRQAVEGHNQLLIWAGGNSGNANVGWPAAAPSQYPAAERGWIAVVWLDPDGTLDRDSNACGIAANWCVSSFSGHRELLGTSFAAPVVTATAGLVSEAFPWMDNSALRQTLLSTADAIGDPEIYGWGRINPDRAVRGPARFDRSLALGSHFNADFDYYRSEFFNDIKGDAGLSKSGNGTLVLWGQNTYTGDTEIHGGRLELYGSIAGNVWNTFDGRFSSNGGRIGGTLTNESFVEVSGAGLRINGRLLTDMGTLQVQFGSSITVDGEALIDGGSLDIVGMDPHSIFTEQAPVLHALKVHGEFADVSGGGLLRDVQAVYLGHQVDVLVERKKATAVANEYFEKHDVKRTAANAIDASLLAVEAQPEASALAALDTGRTVVSQATEPLPTVNQPNEPSKVSKEFIEKMGALHDVSSVAELGKALDSLTGEIHATSQALSFQQAQTINRALSNRVDTLTQPGQESGLWVAMAGADGKLRQRGYTTANTHVFGAQLGADHRLSEASIVGAALSWSEGNARFEGLGGNSKGQSIGVSLYGRYGEQSGNYLAGRIGHDRIQSSVSRSIVIGQSERIDSNRRDGMTSLYAEVGHVFDAMDAKYTPFVGAEYNRLKRGCFEETGSALALRASSASYDEAAVSLGMHYQSSPISWVGGQTIIQGSGAYRYSNAPNLNFSAAFNGAPDASFTLQGIGLPKHSGWVGLGVTTQPNSSGVNWFVSIDTRLDRKGVSNNAISAGLRYDFG